jgi:hypothetical protein
VDFERSRIIVASIGGQSRQNGGAVGRRTRFLGRLDEISLVESDHVAQNRLTSSRVIRTQGSWTSRPVKLTGQSTDMFGMKTLNELIESTGHSDPPYPSRTGKNPFSQLFDRIALILKFFLTTPHQFTSHTAAF